MQAPTLHSFLLLKKVQNVTYHMKKFNFRNTRHRHVEKRTSR
jgi:hypothetical protein